MTNHRISSNHIETLTTASILIDQLAKELYIVLDKERKENPPIADNSDHFIVHEYFFIQCDRFISALDSLALLFPPLCQDLNREYAIGILLRSALLDVGILQYLWVSTTEKSETERISYASKKIRSINTKQLENYLRHRKQLVEEGTITRDKYGNELNHLYQCFEYAFKGDEAPKEDDEIQKIIVKDKKPIGARAIRNALKGKKQYGFFRLDPILLYEHYCKYEHYGLIGAHLRLTHTNNLVQNVLSSTYLIVDSLRRTMIALLNAEHLPEAQETKCQELSALLLKRNKVSE